MKSLTSNKYGGLAETDIATVVLKCGDTFLVTDPRGNLTQMKRETGLFQYGTRFLRTCDLSLIDDSLLGLSHAVSENGRSCQFDLCNPHIPLDPSTTMKRGSIHINRQLELEQDQLIQTITITSFYINSVSIGLKLTLGADFCDILEMRGRVRREHGELLPPQIHHTAAIFIYRGRDAVERETRCLFTPAADHIYPDGVVWDVELAHGQLTEIRVLITMKACSKQHSTYGVTDVSLQPLPVEVRTKDALFNRLFHRGMHDLLMMCTALPQGLYPYAGIPWYVCPFGRDGLITSLEFLPWFPEVARGTLRFLAAHQGTKVDPFTNEEPGKILHELRQGELANCREIPFIPYYGSIDATPFFLITLEAYIRWTNDLSFLKELWPHAEAAVDWMMNFGDSDGDTFLEYHKYPEMELVNQGWKDSSDSVSHRDGKLSEFPIALCEAQGYAYAAYCSASYLAERLGKMNNALHWSQIAKALQTNFLSHFWWGEEQVFYLALDGEKRPCEVVTSNTGQCLWTGIVPATQAQAIVARLMREDMYNGWGIRTLSAHAKRYSPISYHNGSVWPHDTALVGAGFARYGKKFEAGILLENLCDASLYYDQARLPELFCGFARHRGYGPVNYPTACAPQAWTTGAPFLLLSALLGVQPDAENHCLTLQKPTLPDRFHEMELYGLRLGEHRFHLHVEFSEKGVDIHIIGDSNLRVLIN